VSYVLDACALIAFFRREVGGEVVRDILMDARPKVAIHAINMYEVYYDLDRTEGIEAANRSLVVAVEVGIEIREDMDPTFWKVAGQLKSRIKKISVADSFAIALTNRLDATLVTSDHAEFDKIAERNICKILFIR
jgi:PIN domain nuclease of toxin-antitoxin system